MWRRDGGLGIEEKSAKEGTVKVNPFNGPQRQFD